MLVCVNKINLKKVRIAEINTRVSAGLQSAQQLALYTNPVLIFF